MSDRKILLERSKYPFHWTIVNDYGRIEIEVEVEPDAEECESSLALSENDVVDIIHSLGYNVVERLKI